MEYCIYPKYLYPLLFTLYFSSASPFNYLCIYVQLLGHGVVNSVDPDQMPRSAASDLRPNYLFRSGFFSNT